MWMVCLETLVTVGTKEVVKAKARVEEVVEVVEVDVGVTPQIG